MWRDFVVSEEGQGASELMLVISVIVLGTVSAAYTFVPIFRAGVSDLAGDVMRALNLGGGGGGGAGAPFGAPHGPQISIPMDGTVVHVNFEHVVGAGVAALAVMIAGAAFLVERGQALTLEQENAVRGWMADYQARGGTMETLNQARAAVANSGGDVNRAYDIVSGNQSVQPAVYQVPPGEQGPGGPISA